MGRVEGIAAIRVAVTTVRMGLRQMLVVSKKQSIEVYEVVCPRMFRRIE